jgi:hypothetical protein
LKPSLIRLCSCFSHKRTTELVVKALEDKRRYRLPMGLSDKLIEEIEAYKDDFTEDLTVNDALILVAVCAAKEESDNNNNLIRNKNRIVALAKDHPVFLKRFDGIEPSVNRFMNMIKSSDIVKYIIAAAKVLKPEHKETALTWAAMILMSDGVLTENRKNILDKYAMLLNIDRKSEKQILVDVSQSF